MRLPRRIVIPNFSIDERVFNGTTGEKGTVRRVCESNGVTMYEVRIPIDPQGHSIGSNISDWTEDVLDLEGHGRF